MFLAFTSQPAPRILVSAEGERSPLEGRPPAGWAGSPLPLILGLGLVVRLVLWAWFLDVTPQIVDAQHYNLIAVNLARTGEFAYAPGELHSLRSPLYPMVVSVIYRLCGIENFPAVRMFQVGISLLTVLILYRLGIELYSRRVGLWCAALFCFYPSFLGYNNLLLTEVLFTTLLSATCLALVRALKYDSLGEAVAAGFLMGLAALTRSVMSFFLPVLGLYLLAAWPGPFRRRAAAVAAVAIPVVLTLIPWAIRNTRLEKTLIIVDSYGGRNVMLANYEHTRLYRNWDLIEGEKSWYTILERTEPGYARATQGQRDKMALRSAIRFIRAHPWLTLKRDVVKFFNFWGLERELIAEASLGFFGPVSTPAILLMTLVIFGSYVVAVLSGVFGVVVRPPADGRLHGLPLLVIGYINGMHTLSMSHSRYHLPVMALVLVYSACALSHARELARLPRRGALRLAYAACGVFFLGWMWEVFVAYGHQYASVLHITQR